MLNPNTPYVCPACDVATSSTSKLHCHLERHLGQRPFSCRLCPKKYVLKFEANRHIKEKHLRDDVDSIREEDPNYQENPIVSIRCLRCGGVITSRDDLKQHALKHSGVREDDEARAERRDRDRKRAQVKEEPSLRKMVTARWKCVICGEMQPDLTEMTYHLNEHIHCLTYICAVCDLHCESRTSALRHLVERHEGGAQFRVVEAEEVRREWTYVCKCCGDDIGSMHALRIHIELHYTSPDSELAGIKCA